jgi:hypothetical protein
VGEIFSALTDLIGSLAGTDSLGRRRPVVILGFVLVALIAVGLIAAWALG